MMPSNRPNNKRKKTIDSNSSTDDTPYDNLAAEISRLRMEMETRIDSMKEKFFKELETKNAKIEKLEQEVVNLRRNVITLEDRIEDNDAYERRDTVIISGTEVPAVRDDEIPAVVTCNLLKDKVGLVIQPEDVSVAHRLGRKPLNQTTDRRNIIIKFCRRETKQEILKACKTVKPKNIYINESLTPTRTTTLYGLRQAKKRFPNLIAGYGSSDGKVYAWIKPPNPQAPQARNAKMLVNTRRRFIELCDTILHCEATELVDRWPSN